MKKWAIVLVVMGFIFTTSSSSFAMLRKDREAVKGQVVSIDKAKNEIIIKDFSTGQDRTLSPKRGIGSDVQVGLTVTAVVKRGTNVATSLIVVQKRAAAPVATTPAMGGGKY